jgi:7-cyano-7-deazaguanine synthase in queuosine biosynthesis
VLVSGGADSAIGALYSRSLLPDDERHVLVSHFSHTILAPIQRHVSEEVERLVPGPGQEHVAIHLARRTKKSDGSKWATEPSSRSRSLLFLALGLAVASIHEVPLWIPENGFASINPPLGSERLGSLSTRTTHPTFLQGLSTVLAKVGAHGAIENPFASSTKGEMFQVAASLVGVDAASAFLSSTHSCGLTGQRAFGVSSEVPCGVCFGCVLRRASFHASGLHDATNYISPGGNADLQRWLGENSVEQPIRNLLKRGLGARDLATLGLPNGYPMRDALDLCQRGLAELGSLYP